MSHTHKQNMTVCSHKISKFKVKLAEEQHVESSGCASAPLACPAWSTREKIPCLHLFLVLSQSADILLLLLVPLFEDSPLTLVQGNIFPWNTREAPRALARLGYMPYGEHRTMWHEAPANPTLAWRSG